MGNYILMSDGELKHYGVLGMKWGKIRGSQKDPHSTMSAGTKHGSSNTKDDKTSRVKKAVKIGTAATATVLAAYGGYKINDFLNSCTYTVNGKHVSRKEFMSTIRDVRKSLKQVL